MTQSRAGALLEAAEAVLEAKVIRKVALSRPGDIAPNPKEVHKEETVNGFTLSMVRDHAKEFYFIVYKGKPADLEELHVKAKNNGPAKGQIGYSAHAGSRTIGKWMKAAAELVKAGETDIGEIITTSRKTALGR